MDSRLKVPIREQQVHCGGKVIRTDTTSWCEPAGFHKAGVSQKFQLCLKIQIDTCKALQNDACSVQRHMGSLWTS
jgi:hypothetical protein